MNTISYALKRYLRTSKLGRTRLYLAIRYHVNKNQVDKIITKYNSKKVSTERREYLRRRMRNAMIVHRWDFDEFFLFNYEKYDEKRIKSFVPEFDKNIFADMINDKRQADVFLDKWTTYEYFKDFFGRDVYNIRSLADLNTNEFELFVKNHKDFIVKPVFGTRGAGIEVYRDMTVCSAKERITSLYNSGVTAVIVEELIVQDKKLATLHPQSVNTIRVITICFDDRVDIIRASLRIGKGNSVIDNASAGGVLGVIDVKTGLVYAACDKLGNTFDKHPDTNIDLVGFEIPRWNQVKELVQNAARVLPKVRYVGWDVAVTKTGCVLIEGNDKAQLGFQIPKQEGFRDDMNAILRELGKPELN